MAPVRRFEEILMKALFSRKPIYAAFAVATYALSSTATMAQSPGQRNLEICVGKTDDTYQIRVAACNETLKNPGWTDEERSKLLAIRGAFYFVLNDDANAIKDTSEAIRLDPTNILAYENRGLAYRDSKQDQLAIPDLSKAIATKPEDEHLLDDRAKAYFNGGQFDLALADFKRVVTINPKNAIAFLLIAEVYDIKDQPALTLEYMNKSLALSVDPLRLTTRARAYSQLQRYNDATADLNAALKLDDKYELAYFTLAKNYAVQRKWDDAFKNYSLAAALDPSDTKVFNERALVYLIKGNYSAAITDATTAIALDSDQPQPYITRADAYKLVGDQSLAGKTSNYVKALKDFEKAHKLAPADSSFSQDWERVKSYIKINSPDKITGTSEDGGSLPNPFYHPDSRDSVTPFLPSKAPAPAPK
jgi:tetratricopeptide (TPR) repeat protein